MSGPVIVMDGPAGSGKSTMSKELAARLGLPYLDTGAIYRAVAWRLDGLGIAPAESDELSDTVSRMSICFDDSKVQIDGYDVTAAIRTAALDSIVSLYAALPSVRGALLHLQRAAAANGLIAEGRDMGTVVFPCADLKIYLTASVEERARRRWAERATKGIHEDMESIKQQVEERDRMDSGREHAPLAVSEGAVIVDTTGMSPDEVLDRLCEVAKKGLVK